MPARFRERLGAGFVLTIAQGEPCLALYPANRWADVCAKLEAVPVKDVDYRKMVRYLFAVTEEVSCDSQGRLVIPAALRAYAHIDKDVISIGALTRVELWSRDRYEKSSAEPPGLADFAATYGLY